MAIVITVTSDKEIHNTSEFCRYYDGELTYIGEFANMETSEILQGPIVLYEGEYFIAGSFCIPGISDSTDEYGRTTKYLKLYEIDFVPDEYKKVSDCPIHVTVWDYKWDNECPLAKLAFYDHQRAEAERLVESEKDVDIFVNGVKVTREDFLKR